MFVDRVKVFVRAGSGGRGCVSFRREAFVPRGGPSGGNGGRGGDVYLVAASDQNTLLPLRFNSEFRAERGGHGGSNNRTGRDGEPLFIDVPPGTIAFDESINESIGEVTSEGDRLLVAKGGRGGRGNRAFLSNRNRAPREAETGEPGQERFLRLELRLLADVGLLGCPNAGKSTLLSRLSAARPRIDAFPFTTLTPVLGVVEEADQVFVMADIPGIIEGAHRGQGLGLRFLRHVERTRVLLHVVDASGTSGRDAASDLRTVLDEVRAYDPALADRPQIVAASKRDIVKEPDPLPALAREAGRIGLEVTPISAVTGAGLPQLTRRLSELLERTQRSSGEERR
jgi:GTP-binding protein